MNLENVVGLLVLYCLVREIIYISTVNKLVNKLMSRNYYDYQFTQNLKPADKSGETKIKLEDPEDLGALGEFKLF